MGDLSFQRFRAAVVDAEIHPFHIVGEEPTRCNAILEDKCTTLTMLADGETIPRTPDELWDLGNFPIGKKKMPLYEPKKPTNTYSEMQIAERKVA